MLRKRLSDLYRATGGALRQVTGRGPSSLGSIGRLADLRATLPGVLDYTVLHPVRPVTLDDEQLCALLARQRVIPHSGCTFQTEQVFLCTLAGATFDSHSGAVWAADGTLLVDSIKNDGRLKHVAAGPVETRPLPGLYSSITSPIAGNTFHWLIETLPRIYSLAYLDEPVTLLMPDTLPARRLEETVACLPPNVTLRLVPATARLQVERFALPSFLTTQWDFTFPPREHTTYVRDCFYRAFNLSPEAGGRRRVYISRARASQRRVVNEDEVLKELRPRGFETHYLEDLPFAEQVALLHDAEAVIAPHGAGLSNLIFAGRIPVLEFLGRSVTPIYFFLALSLGQTYHYLYPRELDEDEQPPRPADPRRYDLARADISVAPAALRAALDAMGL